MTTYDSQVKIKEGYCWQIRSQFNSSPLTCPVSLLLTFHMPIPASTSRIRTRQMLAGKIPHIKRPDLDNLSKFVLDCLQPLVLRDDSQVYELVAKKVYSEKPGTSIIIYPYMEGNYAIEEGQKQKSN